VTGAGWRRDLSPIKADLRPAGFGCPERRSSGTTEAGTGPSLLAFDRRLCARDPPLPAPTVSEDGTADTGHLYRGACCGTWSWDLAAHREP